jgi:hypothetical protein
MDVPGWLFSDVRLASWRFNALTEEDEDIPQATLSTQQRSPGTKPRSCSSMLLSLMSVSL